MASAGELSDEPAAGPVQAQLAEEFPGLALWTVEVRARAGRSGAGLKARLKAMSDRLTGAQAIAMRQRPIPYAYRVFFRHVGLDPEQTRTPVEQAALDRLQHGRLRERNRVDDALLVAVVETGVPVRALDADKLTGGLRLRLAREEDAFVPSGRIALADDERALVELFGPTVPDAGVTKETERIVLYAIAVAGVPEICVEEALWLARTALVEHG
jgi:DNA/RNA-binding domain of Phe-tRNA-synthetase-like protein